MAYGPQDMALGSQHMAISLQHAALGPQRSVAPKNCHPERSEAESRDLRLHAAVAGVFRISAES
jgi:hypothetical protein